VKNRMPTGAERGQVLVAIMNNKADLSILQEQGWYRIPVAKAPKRWPPKWLAFYQTKVFGDEAFAVNYYGLVRHIRIVRRRELFPNEVRNPKSERQYYQIHLRSLERRPAPIYSRRLRRVVFIPTTWEKFSQAVEINDLFDESPLEDRLWAELKRLRIAAERQWAVPLGKEWYFLDFALFCTDGSIDIETDGDAWHVDREQTPKDNRRNNALASAGWHVLRFNGRQIHESMSDYCVPEIAKTINSLGGLVDEGLVPRVFHQGPEGLAQQLSLFEESTEYDLD
jgi:very-short-patch-repair endonuclease